MEEWRDAINNITERLEKGEQLYKQLMEARPEGADLIVCPEHLGDTIWIAVFASAYLQEHNCNSVYYVVKEFQNEMVMLFPDVGGTIALSNEEMTLLRTYMIVMRLWNQNHIIYAHSRADLVYKDNRFLFVQYPEGISMADTRLRWLGVNGNYMPSKMLQLEDDQDTELSDMFGKAILLLPTAQSMQSIPKAFWKSLVERYLDEGYTVYTNYNGFKYEYVVEGTKPLSSTIMELARISPYFAQIIALRSGACDLLAETESNLSTLYCYEMPERGIVLNPGDVKWDSIHLLTDRKEMYYYQYLPGESDELISVLFEHVRK
ncbi:MAG: hypothetical protein K6G27_08940 [Lachnospiraceae bacterium]|nr:hypothetical protein [Lachnospiraceae bacterium]